MVELLKSKGARLLFTEYGVRKTGLQKPPKKGLTRRASFWKLPEAPDDKQEVSDDQKPVSGLLG